MWVNNAYLLNDQCELWSRSFASKKEAEALTPLAKTEFGKCWWNSDVGQGRSLLSQRTKEINGLIENLLKADYDIVCSNLPDFSKQSDVSTQLKNLIKRIDNSIWNWICDLFTGSLRALKNEEKKLEQLYRRYESIVETVKSDISAPNDLQIAINDQIDRFVKRLVDWYDIKDVKALTAELDTLKTDLKLVKSTYFRKLFLDRIHEAEMGPLKALLEP